MSLKITAAFAAAWQRFATCMRPDPTKMPKFIDERLARDIGMSKVELERHRFVWPSQSADHPKL